MQGNVYSGQIMIPNFGLWLVYAELRVGSRALETWLPVEQTLTGKVSEHRAIYGPVGAGPQPMGEYVGGGLLLAVGAALVAWAAPSVRRLTVGDPRDRSGCGGIAGRIFRSG
jgi:hypothetical protein